MRPRRFTSRAILRVCSRSARSPTTTAAPRSTRSPTASTRSLLRTLTTTSCLSSSSVCAANRPRPSAEPVMKTRAIRPLRASGVGAARGGVERAKLAGDRVGVLVEADRRVTRGQERHVGLEVRVALLQALVDERDPLLVGERVLEAFGIEPVTVVHDDRRDGLDAPVDLGRAEAEGAAAAHADHADAFPVDERPCAQVVDGCAEVLDEDVRGGEVARLAAAVAVERR